MTEFTLGTAYACPLAMIDAGNELMYLIGYGPGDKQTFFVRTDENGDPDPWLDVDGNPFAVANGRYKQEWVNRLTADLDTYPVPDWAQDVDLALAKQGQAALQLIPEEGEPAPMVIADPMAIRVQLTGYNPQSTPLGSSPEFGPFETSLGVEVFFRRLGGTVQVGFDFDPDVYPDFWVPLADLVPGNPFYDAVHEVYERKRRYV